ncbi:MAG: hypothetical protein M9894_23990 [Planctomycetes bacterium]|nr:hypothetical protein [Planctomycetota bacterium]
MADTTRRDLERRARQGDPTAAARALSARVRAGALTDERLRLAALVGDAAARLALGPAAPAEPADADGLAAALQGFGVEAVVRATVAATRAVTAVADPRAGWDLARARRAMDAAEAWLACPCDAHVEAARAVGQAGDEDPAYAELAPAWAVLGPASARLLAAEVALNTAAGELGDAVMRRGLRRALGGWALE